MRDVPYAVPRSIPAGSQTAPLTQGGQMKLSHVKTSVILGSIVALAIASSATGQSTTKLWTSDVVADRQRLMKLNGASWADAQAKLKIWQKWPEFESAVKNYGMQAEKLRDAARTKDLAATEAVAKEFGRQACGTCHTPFRVPPPQQQPAAPQQQPTR